MSEDPIRQYSGATNELDIALKNVHSMSKYILSVGDALSQNPFRFMVANVKTGFPIEVTFDKGTPRLNADEWPTAEKIAETLSDLHQKKQSVINAWHSLTNADRNIVTKHSVID